MNVELDDYRNYSQKTARTLVRIDQNRDTIWIRSMHDKHKLISKKKKNTRPLGVGVNKVSVPPILDNMPTNITTYSLVNLITKLLN